MLPMLCARSNQSCLLADVGHNFAHTDRISHSESSRINVVVSGLHHCDRGLGRRSPCAVKWVDTERICVHLVELEIHVAMVTYVPVYTRPTETPCSGARASELSCTVESMVTCWWMLDYCKSQRVFYSADDWLSTQLRSSRLQLLQPWDRFNLSESTVIYK